jgi:hypothetical protein
MRGVKDSQLPGGKGGIMHEDEEDAKDEED